MNEIKTRTDSYTISYQAVIFIMMMSGYKGIAYYISAIFLILLMLKFIRKNKNKISINKSWNDFVFFIIYYTITSITFYYDANNFRVYMIYYIILFSPLLIMQHLLNNESKKTAIDSLKCFIIVFIAFCLISIVYYIINPGTARDMAAHLVEERLAIGGGYSLAYAAAILGVYLFSKVINGRIKKQKYVILIIVICTVLVILTESAITLFAMLIGYVISIITKNSEEHRKAISKITKGVFVVIVVIFLLSIIMGNKYEIADYILDFTSGKNDEVIYKRITEVVNEIVYGKSTRHVDVRSNTLTQSINIIKEYPLFGIGYKYGNVFSIGKYMYNMGNHSEILDSIARYGIIGGYFLLMPYFRTMKLIFKKNFGCVVTIFLMMYFNPFISFHTNAIMFFVIPIVEELLKRRDNTNERNEEDSEMEVKKIKNSKHFKYKLR